MFQWLKKAFQGTKRGLGKVKSGIEYGAKIYNKAKEVYNAGKNFASNLPVVGTAAGNAIANFENRANEAVKSRIGADFKDLNKAVSTAETVAKYLPSG
jgi:hypothetical protein